MSSRYSVFNLHNSDPTCQNNFTDISRDSDGSLTSNSLSLLSAPDSAGTSRNTADNSIASDVPGALHISSPLTTEFEISPFDRRGIHEIKSANQQRTVNFLKSQLLQVKRRVRALEDESNALKEYAISIMLDKERLEDELSRVRMGYYEELGEAKARRLQLEQAHIELTDLKKRFAEAERFIFAMVDLKLEVPVLYRAAESVLKEGGGAEEALINSIKDAATNKRSAWSRIVPILEGPRTIEHYLAALDLAIHARRKLREREKVARFWKMMAKADPALSETLTPSSSALEEMEPFYELTPTASRSKFVDELVGRLKETVVSGGDSRQTTELHDKKTDENSPTLISSKTVLGELVSPAPVLPGKENGVASALAKHIGSTGATARFLHDDPPPPSRSRTWDPPPRQPLQNVDQNRASNIPRRSPTKHKTFRSPLQSSPSPKGPAKRRGIIIHEKMQSLAAAAKRLSDSQSHVQGNFQDEPSATGSQAIAKSESSDSFRTSASSFSDPPPDSLHIAQEVSYPPALSPRSGQILDPSFNNGSPNPHLSCQSQSALDCSCAACSGSSLGSLETTEEERERPPIHNCDLTTTSSSAVYSSQGNTSVSGEARARTTLTAVAPTTTTESLEVLVNSNDSSYIADDGDLNTTLPAGEATVLSAPITSGVRKFVKWAVPLSPEQKGPLATSSTSSSLSSDSGRVTSTTNFKSRKRSPSSPTPTRRSVVQSAKSNFSRSTQILKPQTAFSLPTTPRKTSMALTSKRMMSGSTALPVTPKRNPESSPVAKGSSNMLSSPPAVPPRSPLRPGSSVCRGKFEASSPRGKAAFRKPGFAAPINAEGTSKSSDKTKDRDEDLDAQDVNVKLTSLPQSSAEANVRLYDYTRPMKPLKVVKKRNPGKAVAFPPVDVEVNEEAHSEAPSSEPSATPLVSGTHSSKASISGRSSPSSSTEPNGSNMSVTPGCLEAPIIASPVIPGHVRNRLSGDLTTAINVQAKHPGGPINTVSPMRTSSLRPPKDIQARMHMPQLGPMTHAKRLRGAGDTLTGAGQHPGGVADPVIDTANAQVHHSSASNQPPAAAATIPNYHRHQHHHRRSARASTPSQHSIDVHGTSPLSRLRLTISPPAALVRSISRSRQMMVVKRPSGASMLMELANSFTGVQ